jgi:hypothetical protein
VADCLELGNGPSGSIKCGDFFLTGYETGSFSERALLHGDGLVRLGTPESFPCASRRNAGGRYYGVIVASGSVTQKGTEF